eukprot:gnl/TRDRNA2_/TRDRNA2_91466_c0_seq1.p1 gnl/TRDRNA2_/TRDRNA2_91466_c0~~gnl/TRDRNA2_/TRDRNA2_91466_c0_seq1.p1  ORF type:complete len:461 (+),score=64.36 gnl/TRDRNA2_/TRDRNA2_91466_c0_seq1:70-1383(+)
MHGALVCAATAVSVLCFSLAPSGTMALRLTTKSAMESEPVAAPAAAPTELGGEAERGEARPSSRVGPEKEMHARTRPPRHEGESAEEKGPRGDEEQQEDLINQVNALRDAVRGKNRGDVASITSKLRAPWDPLPQEAEGKKKHNIYEWMHFFQIENKESDAFLDATMSLLQNALEERDGAIVLLITDELLRQPGLRPVFHGVCTTHETERTEFHESWSRRQHRYMRRYQGAQAWISLQVGGVEDDDALASLELDRPPSDLLKRHMHHLWHHEERETKPSDKFFYGLFHVLGVIKQIELCWPALRWWSESSNWEKLVVPDKDAFKRFVRALQKHNPVQLKKDLKPALEKVIESEEHHADEVATKMLQDVQELLENIDEEPSLTELRDEDFADIGKLRSKLGEVCQKRADYKPAVPSGGGQLLQNAEFWWVALLLLILL